MAPGCLPWLVVERKTQVRVVGVVALVTIIVGTFVIFGPIIEAGGAGFDTHAYWIAWRHHHLYGIPVGFRDAYLYSPAFAQAFWPLSQLSWPVVGIAWAILSTCVLAWLLAPTGRWAPLLTLACAQTVIAGNVEVLYAALLVFGFRRPALWAFAALTKLTPCVGPVWFAARREWRKLTETLVVTIVIAGVSYATAPHLWHEWAAFLSASKEDAVTGAGRLPLPGLFFRLPVALALTVFAARRNTQRLLPVAMLLGFPSVGFGSLAVLAAIPRLGGRSFGVVDTRLRSAPACERTPAVPGSGAPMHYSPSA